MKDNRTIDNIDLLNDKNILLSDEDLLNIEGGRGERKNLFDEAKDFLRKFLFKRLKYNFITK